MKHVYITLILVLLMATAMSQDNSQIGRPALQHEMTPDELLRKGEIGRGFVETNPPVAPVRNVAEFDRMQGALVRYPFGIPISLIKEMATDVTVTTIVSSITQKNAVLSQYVANGVDTSHCDFLIAPSDSYWTRDYGPWFESDSANQIGIVDFPYNRPRPNDDEIPKKVAEMLGIPWYGMNIITAGGNYMTDGYGISSSTNLVWVENPTQTHEQIAQKMNDYLGITNFQVVPDPNISTGIDHIDCWGKFLAPDKMLIRKVLTNDPEYTALESAATYWASQTCSYGYNYKIYRVMTPQDQPYSNSVILNNKVLLPFMNSAWDDSAKAVYEAAMPGYQVIGFLGNPSTPWISTDALHCRVMGVADIGLLHLKHIPVSGNQPCETDYTINTDIIASSQQPVIADSAIIHYQVNGGPYNTTLMVNTTSNHYTGMIPKQPAGSVIKYYLTAADQSGRHASAPFIGAADPFTFQTVYTNLAAVPDTLWFIEPIDCLNGKITQLHNYTPNGISLDTVQQFGYFLPWYVDSMSVTSIPHLVNPGGDSVAIRVKMPLPLLSNPAVVYVTDSLRISTTAGNFYVIIMINQDLLTSVIDPASPGNIGCNYPNPFSSVTSIPLEITHRSHVTLDILDIRGVKVKTLVSGVFGPGIATINWNGTDSHGNKLPGGIYLCRMISENKAETKRLILTE
ncbi:MAG: agmatine deiminase family protein [Bacteroidales bacterium]|nr:agmatine deiminase family protein [Bacteroidales bacterium]